MANKNDELMKFLSNEEKAEYEKMAGAVNPYGDGFASVRIADAIIKKFEK